MPASASAVSQPHRSVPHAHPQDDGQPELEASQQADALTQLDHVAVGSDRSVLDAIRGAGTNLAVWQRHLPSNIAAEIDAAGPDSFAYIDERFGAASSVAVLASWLEKSRFPGALGLWLVSDMAALVDDAARLGGSDRVRLKIETLTDTKCSRFHCDMTLIRLITAYHGAGTEFVADSIADDVFLRDMLPPRSQILSAPRDSVCMLRGAQPAAGFAERAIVHRSPDIHRPEDWRLLVTVDALTE